MLDNGNTVLHFHYPGKKAFFFIIPQSVTPASDSYKEHKQQVYCWLGFVLIIYTYKVQSPTFSKKNTEINRAESAFLCKPATFHSSKTKVGK